MRTGEDRWNVFVVGLRDQSHANTVMLAAELAHYTGMPTSEVELALIRGEVRVRSGLERAEAERAAQELDDLGALVEVRLADVRSGAYPILKPDATRRAGVAVGGYIDDSATPPAVSDSSGLSRLPIEPDPEAPSMRVTDELVIKRRRVGEARPGAGVPAPAPLVPPPPVMHSVPVPTPVASPSFAMPPRLVEIPSARPPAPPVAPEPRHTLEDFASRLEDANVADSLEDIDHFTAVPQTRVAPSRAAAPARPRPVANDDDAGAFDLALDGPAIPLDLPGPPPDREPSRRKPAVDLVAPLPGEGSRAGGASQPVLPKRMRESQRPTKEPSLELDFEAAGMQPPTNKRLRELGGRIESQARPVETELPRRTLAHDLVAGTGGSAAGIGGVGRSDARNLLGDDQATALPLGLAIGLAIGMVIATQLQSGAVAERLVPLEQELLVAATNATAAQTGAARPASAIEKELDDEYASMQRSFVIKWLLIGLPIGFGLSRLRRL